MCLVRSVVRLEVWPQSKHRHKKPPSPSDSFCILDFIKAENIEITILVQLKLIPVISLLVFPQSVNVWTSFVAIGTENTLVLDMFRLHMFLNIILAVIRLVRAVCTAPNLFTHFVHPFVDFAIRIIIKGLYFSVKS